MESSDLDLRIAGSADAIIMVEAGATSYLSEDLMLDAMRLAHQSIQDIIHVQNEMREAVGKPKRA